MPHRAADLAMTMLLLAQLVAGCFTPAPSEEISWKQFDSKTVSAASGAAAVKVEIFTNQSALDEAVPAWERFEIDLTNATALRLTWGPLEGVGHEIRIQQVRLDAIDVTLVSPGANCVGGGSWTKEVMWIRVDRPGLEQVDAHTTQLEESCTPRPDRQFHVLLIQGELGQTPPHDGGTVACGRPGNFFAGLDLAREQLYVHESTDFEWAESWLVIHEDVQLVDDMSTCDLSWLSSYEGNYTWKLGSVELAFGSSADGVLVNGLPAQNVTIAFDEQLNGSRFVGEIAVTYVGAWAVRDIVVVPDEQLVTGDVGGFWRE